jgi:hypothetical protein
VAGLTFLIQYVTVMLALSIVTTETVTESSLTKIRSLGIDRIPWFTVSRQMATRNDDRIALDGCIMHHARMTGCTPFALSASLEGLHVSAMVHDQSHIFNRRWKVARGDFGNTEDMTMATVSDL